MQTGQGIVNITDGQKNLLRLLVSKHESGGGEQFIFVRSMSGSGLVYPNGDSESVSNDDLDFQQLLRENLIVLVPLGPNRWRGKPTERGITLVRNGFMPSPDALTRLSGSPTRLGAHLLGSEPAPGVAHQGLTQPPTLEALLSSLPPTIRAAVEAEQIRAERAFFAARGDAPSRDKLEELVKAYIMRVFLAFAKAICKLGSAGDFEIRDIESMCQQFLRLGCWRPPYPGRR